MAGEGGRYVHEKMSAAAAPRKPKKGAVSSPLNADDIFLPYLFLSRWGCSVSGRPRRRGGEEGKVGRQADAISLLFCGLRRKTILFLHGLMGWDFDPSFGSARGLPLSSWAEIGE